MANKLAHSTSPYLRQHADNPVDWHEWGEEALALARAAGKPILLSIGYSACHWCHVMAHESFEDQDIAALMNAHFVNIKVDREERPDLDRIYQTAHELLTRRNGGWPLTMFLTEDTVPFFGGTYFPKTARYGLPGFGELLRRVAAYHREQRGAIDEQNARMRAALAAEGEGDGMPAPVHGHPPGQPLDEARTQLARRFDARHGGFGAAPKFPHPEMIEFLLRRLSSDGDAEAGRMALHTLRGMCLGGIHDQLGGGFARYSVDEEWAIPHFEKMLYDNGPLLRLLADAARIDDAERETFARCAERTAGWVLREMQAPDGGYYASLDADSEGHEGRFYVWTADEARALLSADQWRIAAPYYGLDGPANFEQTHWHLAVRRSLSEIATETGLPPARCAELLAAADARLLAARERRVRPGRDEKILTGWNALMIEGMAHAGRVLDRPTWIDSARRALDFVRTTMWDAAERRLYASHRDGVTRYNAYLDDHAFLIAACLGLLEADFRADDLAFACRLADVLLEWFEDRERGGFYFTGHDHEPLIQRPMPTFDNATPSGNGVAARTLSRLAHLTGEIRYADAAARALDRFAAAVAAFPAGHCSLLMALEESLAPPAIVLLTGPRETRAAWRGQLNRVHLPRAMVLDIGDADPGTLPPILARPAAATVQAHVCHATHCLPPIGDIGKLLGVLESPIIAGFRHPSEAHSTSQENP